MTQAGDMRRGPERNTTRDPRDRHRRRSTTTQVRLTDTTLAARPASPSRDKLISTPFPRIRWHLLPALALILTLGCASTPATQAKPPESNGQTSAATQPQPPVTLLSAGQLPVGRVDLAQLGTVLGATYSEPLGRLFVIGNGLDVDASPSESQLGLALERVAGWRMRPSISIDPRPGELDEPLNDVMMTEEVAHTEFGWVMVEADRRLKGYGLGRDNVTGQASPGTIIVHRAARLFQGLQGPRRSVADPHAL